MDYIDHVEVTRFEDFDAFRAARPGRLVLFTTQAATSLFDVEFRADDLLLFGRESAGVTAEIAAAADAAVRIPIRAAVRSFNLASSAAIALGEALRQTGELPR